MSQKPLLLALDQGTTSTRAIVFDTRGTALGSAQRALAQSFPQDGWVEHDPERLCSDAILVMRGALENARASATAVVALGISNQRETAIVWERANGQAIHPAIVWQDRRTAGLCAQLREQGLEPEISAITGLLLDPYFSATKIAWILDAVPGARARAERGELAAGTVDSWLTWRLSGGAIHATDASNASRTLLFDLTTQRWSPRLCAIFRVPPAILPEVQDTASDFGFIQRELLGAAIPLRALVGDQQAAAFGQGCLEPGSAKATYGTGCFTVQNTGAQILNSRNRLLSTQAWRLKGVSTFALEGSIFHAGTVVQWLREGLGLLGSSQDAEKLARSADSRRRVYLVPAFTGLGAPWWDPSARGALHGLTRETNASDLARAALEAACFQTRDLLDAARSDGAEPPSELRVDGGMARNEWFLQALADLCALPIARSTTTESTARGAALLAGVSLGLQESEEAARSWQAERRWLPRMGEDERSERHAGWLRAVRRTLSEN